MSANKLITSEEGWEDTTQDFYLPIPRTPVPSLLELYIEDFNTDPIRINLKLFLLGQVDGNSYVAKYMCKELVQYIKALVKPVLKTKYPRLIK
jgi:hypothetical protein